MRFVPSETGQRRKERGIITVHVRFKKPFMKTPPEATTRPHVSSLVARTGVWNVGSDHDQQKGIWRSLKGHDYRAAGAQREESLFPK